MFQSWGNGGSNFEGTVDMKNLFCNESIAIDGFFDEVNDGQW